MAFLGGVGRMREGGLHFISENLRISGGMHWLGRNGMEWNEMNLLGMEDTEQRVG